jgi:hypothetical protein
MTVTTPGNEMEIVRAIIAMQTLGHEIRISASPQGATPLFRAYRLTPI